MKKIIFFFLLFISFSYGETVFLNQSSFYTGDFGIARIKGFEKNARYEIVLKNKYGRWAFPVKEDTAFFSVPLLVKGKYISFYLKKNGKVVFSKRLKVKHKKYRVSKIWVKKRKITKEVLKRIKEENNLLRKTFKVYTEKLFIEKKMHKPLKKLIVTTPFGAKRIINGKKRSYHWGTDFKGKTGDPIFASLSGKVVVARDMFFTGKTVVINHGLGLYTLYAHMSRIDVKEGDFVKAGDIIGRVGSTGRSTAPHLHFGVYINDIKADPMLVLSKRFDNN
ncbi:MAG: M23 family metallopeptidase [Aquificae bacterium]|nr:M23 family metallopeptidase [Aquificota bacterium]